MVEQTTNKHFRGGVDVNPTPGKRLDVNPRWRHGMGYNFSTCADGWSMALSKYRRGIGADAACIDKLRDADKSLRLAVHVANYAVDGQPCHTFC